MCAVHVSPPPYVYSKLMVCCAFGATPVVYRVVGHFLRYSIGPHCLVPLLLYTSWPPFALQLGLSSEPVNALVPRFRCAKVSKPYRPVLHNMPNIITR